MKRVYCITVISALLVIAAGFLIWHATFREKEQRQIRVGVVCIGDAANAYTYNFMSAMAAVEQTYGERVEIIPKYNILEGKEAEALEELAEEQCDLIISTSYGYGETVKHFAEKYPKIEFCQATCDNANTEPVLGNYHTFMGEIYQGRYICGVVAGMKMKELIDRGELLPEEAKVGYVAAFPYAEVISGYTAFFLGVRSEVSTATMEVIYTDTWGNYALENKAARRLIEDRCVVISQHSDTRGAAVACENTDQSVLIYHVGYNQGMTDIAPTTNLTGCRINWEPYLMAAVGAVLEGKKIEDAVAGNVHGQDIGAGFEKGWVEMLPINEVAAAPGTKERINALTDGFKRGEIMVFQGDYTGVNPFDETDVYDLQSGYRENADASAPGFHYVLQDVITIVE